MMKVEEKEEDGGRKVVDVHTAAESDKGLWAYQCATPGFMYQVEEG